MNSLITYLTDEKQAKCKGGLYHKTQVNLAYNSNRIEGSRLTKEQTRHIFETRTIGFKDEEAVPVDDIIETSNHFVAFDFLLDTVQNPLTSDIIKEFHRILKTGTSDALKPWFAVGEWKKTANEFDGTETAKPENVENEINKLNEWYRHCEDYDFRQKNGACHCGTESNSAFPQYSEYSKTMFENIVEYHYRFEKIYPFQDGNGRVGRLIMFRECLRNDIVPFIIDEWHKQFYYSTLNEGARVKDYLLDICLLAQNVYTAQIRCFYNEN